MRSFRASLVTVKIPLQGYLMVSKTEELKRNNITMITEQHLEVDIALQMLAVI